MFNEYEAVYPEVAGQFKDIEIQLHDFMAEMAKTYSTIEIEQYLNNIVSLSSAEVRLTNAIKKRRFTK